MSADGHTSIFQCVVFQLVTIAYCMCNINKRIKKEQKFAKDHQRSLLFELFSTFSFVSRSIVYLLPIRCAIELFLKPSCIPHFPLYLSYIIFNLWEYPEVDSPKLLLSGMTIVLFFTDHEVMGFWDNSLGVYNNSFFEWASARIPLSTDILFIFIKMERL